MHSNNKKVPWRLCGRFDVIIQEDKSILLSFVQEHSAQAKNQVQEQVSRVRQVFA
jgi:hypothetical protein